MRNAERFAFTAADSKLVEASFQPYLPITLTYHGQSRTVSSLLDTGATVNVLPYQVGLDLGTVWEQMSVPVQLTGNLAQFEARALIVSASVGRFAPVRLVFAWTQATNVPVLLGQVNFFMEFDVCFYRSQLAFEIRPKQT
jgi:hypothetical protein